MKKFFDWSFIVLSFCMMISFFLTWIDFPEIGFKMSGASIPISRPQMNDLILHASHNNLQDTSFLVICYLLYLIPILVIIRLITFVLGYRRWFFHFDFLVTFIAVVVTYEILVLIDEEAPYYLVYGYFLTAIFASLGLLLQIVKGICQYLKKPSKDKHYQLS